MTRVAFLKNKKKIYELKSKNRIIDDLIALERRKIFKSSKIPHHCQKTAIINFLIKSIAI